MDSRVMRPIRRVGVVAQNSGALFLLYCRLHSSKHIQPKFNRNRRKDEFPAYKQGIITGTYNFGKRICVAKDRS